MDKLRPSHLTRGQLQAFLGDRPDLVRAFEVFIQALANDVPDDIDSLQLAAANASALIASLDESAQRDRADTEAAQVLALSAAVDQLRERLSTGEDATLISLAQQIAQLREDITAGTYVMKRKRKISGSISLVATLTNTYTISPPLSSTSMADLRYLGAVTTVTTVDAATVSVVITDVSTVTATRGNSTGNLTAYFEIVEFTQ